MEVAIQHLQNIGEAGGSEWKDKSMTAGTYVSAAVDVRRTSGKGSLLVKSTAGKIVITAEVSDDNKAWYTPYAQDGSSMGEIHDNLTANTWIEFTIPVAKYIRFTFVVSIATSTVSAVVRNRSYQKA